MKKKTFIKVTALAMASMLALSACGNTDNGENEPVSESASAVQEEEGFVNMGNPWVTITSSEARDIIPRLFVAPEGSTDENWTKCEDLGDTEKGISPMIQLNFTLDGNNFNARAQMGIDENTDIGGNYVEWTDGPDTVKLATWAGGNMEAKTYCSVNDTGYVDQINWYDVEIGISYCLSVAAEDLDGFDIQAVAEAMAPPEEFMPGSFVEEAAGKETFESYDELISYLKADNGYAFFELEGYDGDLLAVTEETFDDLEGHQAAIDATFYGEIDGVVRFVGNAFSGGTAYPIRCDGSVIYSAGNHEFNSEFMDLGGRALIVKDYVSVSYDESGNASYSGFRRADRAASPEDIPSDPAEAEKIFDSLFAELEDKNVMDFTVVLQDGHGLSTASLPAYEYPGPELFYSVLYQYLIDEYGKNYGESDVTIPCPIIVKMDESDKNDIKVWGNFWIYNYNLKGNTLENVSGGSYPGLIHIQSTDDAAGYKVTSMELVGDGSDYDPTAKKIFGNYYDDFVKSNDDTKANEDTRAQIIANYVAANNLDITAYQDYGWDPVTLPKENIDSFYSILN